MKHKIIEINPVHFPHTERGRPRKGRGRPRKSRALTEKIFPGLTRGRPPSKQWWILDLYTEGYLLDTLIGEGSRPTALSEAQQFIGKKLKDALGKIKKVERVELSGPYEDKPAKDWPRT